MSRDEKVIPFARRPKPPRADKRVASAGADLPSADAVLAMYDVLGDAVKSGKEPTARAFQEKLAGARRQLVRQAKSGKVASEIERQNRSLKEPTKLRRGGDDA